MELSAYITNQIAARPVEARLIRKAVKALKDAGDPVISVNDGEEAVTVKTTKDVLGVAFGVDEATLLTRSGSFVFLTMGEGWDVLCDHSLDLEDALKPVYDYIYEKGE